MKPITSLTAVAKRHPVSSNIWQHPVMVIYTDMSKFMDVCIYEYILYEYICEMHECTHIIIHKHAYPVMVIYADMCVCEYRWLWNIWMYLCILWMHSVMARYMDVCVYDHIDVSVKYMHISICEYIGCQKSPTMSGSFAKETYMWVYVIVRYMNISMHLMDTPCDGEIHGILDIWVYRRECEISGLWNTSTYAYMSIFCMSIFVKCMNVCI